MKEYLKLAIKAVAFGVCFFVVDLLWGIGCSYLRENNKLRKHSDLIQEYAMNYVNTDVIVIGASETRYGVNAPILRDSLGMSIGNCGKHDTGNIYYQCAVINGILDRYSPKMIILSVYPHTSLAISTDKINEEVMQLKTFYGENNYCTNIIDACKPTEKYKLWLNSYKYNPVWYSYLYCMVKHYEEMDKGYDALYGCNVKSKKISPKVEDSFDKSKADTLIHTLQRCKSLSVDVVAYASPTYSTLEYENTIQNKKLMEIFNDFGITFIDLKHDSEIMRPEYFYDPSHLNYDGSVIFTKKLLKGTQRAIGQ